ncbi:helix-turn-helix domain-containing protein [Schleiferiaceae bacterium]|nr:helix-turn-helix domain-containing protein [Schleiferiaceae bacterium]
METSLSVPRPKEKLLSTAEACLYLNVSRMSLYRYMDEGLLAYNMVGKQRRIALTELDRFMDRDRKDALPSIL